MPTIHDLHGIPTRDRLAIKRIADDLKAQELSLIEEERQILELQERADARRGRVKGLQGSLNTLLIRAFDADTTVDVRGELYRTDADVPGLARFVGCSVPDDVEEDDEPSPSEVAEWAADYAAAVATKA